MENKELTPQEQEKSKILTSAVAYKTPDEVREVYKSLGKVEFTARALSYACRFRGLEYVRALVECGATFDYDRTNVMYTYDFHLSLISFNNKRDKNFYMDVLSDVGESVFGDHLPMEGGEKLPVLPLKERIRIAEYLCQNAESAGFDSGELLYYSILTKNFDMANALKRAGAALPEKYVRLLSEGARGVPDGTNLWYEYCMVLGNPHNEGVIKQLGFFREALGDKTLNFTDTIYASIGSQNFYDPELFGFFLSIFNTSKMNKTHMLKIIIKNNLIADLEVAAAVGWLKQPRKRDEMIDYAAENGCAEASAWLLDYKNRTADLAAEQEKAEKKMMRALNADPNSVTELKKIWSYKKREDGTLVITKYKGMRTEVIVPEKIGKSEVTAIGDSAFAGGSGLCAGKVTPNVSHELMAARRKITKLVLPSGLKSIGLGAFADMLSLESIDIPESVTEIGDCAFYECDSLKSVTVPGGVKSIGEYCFARCKNLRDVKICHGVEEIRKGAFRDSDGLHRVEIPASVKKFESVRLLSRDADLEVFDSWAFHLTVYVEKGSAAEKFCKEKRLKYKYMGEE